MIHLIPSVSEQTISILPREYTTFVVLVLRDDSTNDQVQINIPTSVISGNYLNITSTFTLTEGRFYDLSVYKVQDYEDFKQRVLDNGGVVEQSSCIFTFYNSLELIDLTEINNIYKDKIFCTAQNLDQNTNTFYTPNESEYIEQSANNDFIIYD